jgi:pyruvate dehydrogenase E1 component
LTPSVGLEQPGVVAWEPAFTNDFEWCFLHAMGLLGRPSGTSAYFRLSTRPIDQSLAAVPTNEPDRDQRRVDALAGGYRLRSRDGASIAIVVVGAPVVEAIAAADQLAAAGIMADVICLTSPDLIFRALQVRQGLLRGGDWSILERLLPRAVPIVSVLDGHPHTLAFLAAVNGTAIACLGVSDFGQSGDISDLYEHHGIDVDTIVGAALDLTSPRIRRA